MTHPTKHLRGYIDIDFRGLVYLGIAVGVIATLLIVFVVPWIWRLIKPWLHGVTS